MLEGWWGVISLFVANPATILLNLWNLAKVRRLAPPQLSSSLTATRMTESASSWKPT